MGLCSCFLRRQVASHTEVFVWRFAVPPSDRNTKYVGYLPLFLNRVRPSDGVLLGSVSAGETMWRGRRQAALFSHTVRKARANVQYLFSSLLELLVHRT
jgi:hypothetical protein